jgi:hypothetical protein
MTSGLFNLPNYTFNPYAIPTLVTGMAIISLRFFVLVGERNSRVSLGFFVMTLTAATWLLSYSIMYCAANESVATSWASLGHLGITFIPAAVYHFTVGTLQVYWKHKSRVSLAWLVSGISAHWSFTGIVLLAAFTAIRGAIMPATSE